MSRKKLDLNRYIDNLKPFSKLYGDCEIVSLGFDSDNNYILEVQTETGSKTIKTPMYEDMYNTPALA